MQYLRSHGLFFVLSSILLAIGIFLTGYISYLFPHISSFLSAIICGILSIVVIRSAQAKPPKTPFMVFLIAQFFASLFLANQAKSFFYEINLKPTNIPVSKIDPIFPYNSFSDSKLEFDMAGHYTIEHYGSHHYFAVPVVSYAWDKSHPVRLWAWARKVNTKKISLDDLPLTKSEVNYGIILNDQTIEENVKKAIKIAEQKHQIVASENPIIITWGQKPSPEKHFDFIMNRYEYMVISLVVVLFFHILHLIIREA